MASRARSGVLMTRADYELLRHYRNSRDKHATGCPTCTHTSTPEKAEVVFPAMIAPWILLMRI